MTNLLNLCEAQSVAELLFCKNDAIRIKLRNAVSVISSVFNDLVLSFLFHLSMTPFSLAFFFALKLFKSRNADRQESHFIYNFPVLMGSGGKTK